MGCDIHLAVEAREPGGPWRHVNPDYPCDACDGGKERSRCGFCDSTGKAPYHDRWYALFQALADVRGYDDGPPTIARPRGFPPDMVARELGKPNCEYSWGHDHAPEESLIDDPDLHSHSWLPLRELQAYDWEQHRLAGFRRFVDAIAKLGGPDDVRIVFAFDN